MLVPWPGVCAFWILWPVLKRDILNTDQRLKILRLSLCHVTLCSVRLGATHLMGQHALFAKLDVQLGKHMRALLVLLHRTGSVLRAVPRVSMDPHTRPGRALLHQTGFVLLAVPSVRLESHTKAEHALADWIVCVLQIQSALQSQRESVLGQARFLTKQMLQSRWTFLFLSSHQSKMLSRVLFRVCHPTPSGSSILASLRCQAGGSRQKLLRLHFDWVSALQTRQRLQQKA